MARPTPQLQPFAPAPATETISGRVVHFLAPDPASIAAEDIAYSLSRINRFNGATRGRLGLSVAQHSVWVACFCHHVSRSALSGLHGLLHDAAEAYIGDICTPLKEYPAIAGSIRRIEAGLICAVYVGLSLPTPDDATQTLVHEADQQALLREVQVRSGTQGQAPYWDDVNANIDGRRHPQAVGAADQIVGPGIMLDPEGARRLWLDWYVRLRADAGYPAN